MSIRSKLARCNISRLNVPVTSRLNVRLFHKSPSPHSSEMETVHTGERLSQLRQLMKKHQVDVYSMKRGLRQ